MNDVRILSRGDLEAAVRIVGDSYPGMKLVTADDRERYRLRLADVMAEAPIAHFYGYFREQELLGLMVLWDWQMNFLQALLPAGGMGMLAIDPTHRKEHIARDMMWFYLRYYRELGTPLALLYPFRPDFYRQMGFGYGTKMNQYRLRPGSLPGEAPRNRVRVLAGSEDQRSVLECYARAVARTHGMIERHPRAIRQLFERPQYRIVGCVDGARISGYVVYSYESAGSWLLNDLHVHELLYEDAGAFQELLSFLHTQADQVRYVILDTLDEHFHLVPSDPRDGTEKIAVEVYHETNTQGVGLLVRVVDISRLFQLLADHDFGGQTCRLKLTVHDSFLPENDDSYTLDVVNGRLQPGKVARCEVEAELDVASFSSLVYGTATFRSLVRYGLATISDAACVDVVNRLFAVAEKPICLTYF